MDPTGVCFLPVHLLGFVFLQAIFYGLGSHGMKITIIHHHLGEYFWVIFPSIEQSQKATEFSPCFLQNFGLRKTSIAHRQGYRVTQPFPI